MVKFKFVNFWKMHKDHPNKFDIPDEKDLTHLKVGDWVKISNGERFWVEITSLKNHNKYITGIIKNELLDKKDYNLGDIVNFKSRNVCQIKKAEDTH